MSRIVRSTLAEQAYSELRERIMSGRLSAGQRLMPEELAGRLAISPTPIKQALVRLATEGLVEAATRHGAVVRRFTRADITELYEARLLVEAHALRRGFATGCVGPGLVGELRAIQDGLAAHRRRATEEALNDALALDRAFHARLVAMIANRAIAEWHLRVLMQTHSVRIYSVDSYQMDRLQTEHEAVLAALGRGDARAAQGALRRHLTRSRDELTARLGATETESTSP
jgi:DNA-binding GntR family transcriptional regulator